MLSHVAHPAIRNRGTLGGSLAHADPASELPACMVALGATIVVAGHVASDEFLQHLHRHHETKLSPQDCWSRSSCRCGKDSAPFLP